MNTQIKKQNISQKIHSFNKKYGNSTDRLDNVIIVTPGFGGVPTRPETQFFAK